MKSIKMNTNTPNPELDSDELEFKPDYAVHPGLWLEEILKSREIDTPKFLKKIGITFTSLCQILNAARPITPEIAQKLETTLDISAHIWLNMQKDYDNFEEKKE